MSKRRLPPITNETVNLIGLRAIRYTVADWCPGSDAVNPATAVAVVVSTQHFSDVVIRLESPEKVDEMIQALLRHKRHVWPKAN